MCFLLVFLVQINNKLERARTQLPFLANANTIRGKKKDFLLSLALSTQIIINIMCLTSSICVHNCHSLSL